MLLCTEIMKRGLFCVFVFVLVISLVSCENGDNGSFKVSSTSPSSDEVDVLSSASVSVTFSENLDCNTVSATSFKVMDSASNPVTGTYSCSGATATFLPAQLLAFYASYKVTITTEIKNSSGTPLSAEYNWSFRTKKGIVAVRAGHLFSMAMDNLGAIYTWGGQFAYPLGRGEELEGDEFIIPTAIELSPASAMGNGDYEGFAATTDGKVYGWGQNTYGQVGDGRSGEDCVWKPALISGVNGTVIDIASSGVHTLALTSSGEVYAWGLNCSGQLGDNTTTDRLSPVKVQFPEGTIIKAIDTGAITSAPCAYYSMALDSSGNVWVWGGNSHSELAQPSPDDDPPGPEMIPVPTKVEGLSNVTAIAAGFRLAAAVSGGNVYTWGAGSEFVLGDNECFDHRSTPVMVSGLSNVTGITASRYGNPFFLVVKSDNTVWGWGWNENGQLGDGSTGVDYYCEGNPSPITGRKLPVQITGLNSTDSRVKVVDIRAGENHSIAVKNDGTVWIWGNNDNETLGKGVSSNNPVISPTLVPGL